MAVEDLNVALLLKYRGQPPWDLDHRPHGEHVERPTPWELRDLLEDLDPYLLDQQR